MSNILTQVIMWTCVSGICLIALLSKSSANIGYSVLLLIIVFISAAIDMELFYTKYTKKVN